MSDIKNSLSHHLPIIGCHLWRRTTWSTRIGVEICGETRYTAEWTRARTRSMIRTILISITILLMKRKSKKKETDR